MGRLIDERAKQLKLRTVDIAKTLDVDWQTAHSWRQGKSIPNGQRLLKLAKVLQMSPGKLEALLDDAPPTWPAWAAFLEGEGTRLSADQRRRVARAARMMIDDDEAPPESLLVYLAAAVRARAS